MKFFINKKFESFKLLFLIMAVFIFCFNTQATFAKEYYYKDYEVDIKINKDSTFDVTEKQTYYLDGSFGFFNRDISYKDIDIITDIKVFDGENKEILKSELDIKPGFGEKHIQWNFPRRNFSGEEKSWIVKYKVHGGISFLKNYDEIYWNAIPSDRSVPIENVKVTVNLPGGEKFRNDLIQLYSEQVLPKNCYFKSNNTQAIFEGKDLKSNNNFTIAVGFQKDIVSQMAYWKDFLMIYYGYILSVIIFLSCVIIGFVYWYKTERSREGKRAIVPQYEPPQNLRPAMAEVIVKEKLTSKGLAATVIDLAVRGYVKIEEEKKSALEKSFALIVILLLFLFFSIIFFSIVSTIGRNPMSFFGHFILLSLFSFVIFSIISSRGYDYKKNYKIMKTKSFKDDSGLEDYEKKYLNVLFSYKDYFSTKEIKRKPQKARGIYKETQKVKNKVYEETELDTKAFERGLTIEKKRNIIFGILGFIIFILVVFFMIGESAVIGQFLFLILTVILTVIALYAFIKYEARLSDQGIKLKKDWLGFKMYLETAEKYRMQNLKPEFFEKYLPYAMIFGVEKKWAKAFEAIHMPSPSWYAGSAHVGAGSSLNSASSFSPLSFSNSFSSSFTSAFSSPGASGASGGGGGAGGGGGGGGGGAG